MTILAGIMLAEAASRPRRSFFDALDTADDHVREHEDLADAASFAPPVTAEGRCCCGATLIIRSSQVELTDAEHREVVAAVGIGQTVVDHVVAAINRARSGADWAAIAEFQADHASCGGDEAGA